MNALLAAAAAVQAFCAQVVALRVRTGGHVVTCSAEDLVILKAFAGRVQDWLDVEGIIVRQGAKLDRSLVLEELRPLLDLKEDQEGALTLQKLFNKHPQ